MARSLPALAPDSPKPPHWMILRRSLPHSSHLTLTRHLPDRWPLHRPRHQRQRQRQCQRRPRALPMWRVHNRLPSRRNAPTSSRPSSRRESAASRAAYPSIYTRAAAVAVAAAVRHLTFQTPCHPTVSASQPARVIITTTTTEYRLPSQANSSPSAASRQPPPSRPWAAHRTRVPATRVSAAEPWSRTTRPVTMSVQPTVAWTSQCRRVMTDQTLSLPRHQAPPLSLSLRRPSPQHHQLSRALPPPLLLPPRALLQAAVRERQRLLATEDVPVRSQSAAVAP